MKQWKYIQLNKEQELLFVMCLLLNSAWLNLLLILLKQINDTKAFLMEVVFAASFVFL